MANINLYRVSVPPGQYSKVDWTECDINPGPTQYLYDRFTSIDFQAVNNTVSASSAATISIIGYCLDDCTGCYLIGETTTTSTTIPPVNFTISTICEGSGVNGTGKITIGSFSGGNGTYYSVGIGTSAGSAFSATPTLLSGATSYSYTSLTNGTYYIILRDSSGSPTTKNITVNCTNLTTTTTSTTSTTTAAPICNFNGGSATVVYPTTSTTTSTTSTTSTTTEGPTTTTTSTTTAPTSTSTSTTSTSTSTTTAAPAGSFIVKNTSGSGQIDDVVTTGGAYFYFFISGAFPIATGQQADAGGASLTGADIFVDISNYSSTSCLSLYINGGLSGQLEVSGNGTYTFTNKTFTTADTVLIEYVSGICP
jgi:hypothetical protein